MHVWYVQYGDNIETGDMSQIIPAVQTEIIKTDPNAVVQEVKLLPYTLGFYVNHPTYQEVRLSDGTRMIIDSLKLPPGAIAPDGTLNVNLADLEHGQLLATIAIIAIAAAIAFIVASLVIGLVVIPLFLNYLMETRTYTCPGNPATPDVPCGLHHMNPTDPTSAPQTFGTRTEFLAHLAASHPAAYTLLNQKGILSSQFSGSGSSWWENLGNIDWTWVIVGIIAIGGLISIPAIAKALRKKKSENE